MLALLLPLAIASVSVGHLASTGNAAPSSNTAGSELPIKRPVSSQSDAPPTLVAPTPIPPPTPTPAPTPTPRALTYVVQPGDELKHIAAMHGVDVFKLIHLNNIPNPDNLRVGEVLRIPDD